MVFRVKSAPAVGAKDTVINMIINRSLTFTLVDMVRFRCKYHILCWVSILEIMLRMKPYLNTRY